MTQLQSATALRTTAQKVSSGLCHDFALAIVYFLIISYLTAATATISRSQAFMIIVEVIPYLQVLKLAVDVEAILKGGHAFS